MKKTNDRKKNEKTDKKIKYLPFCFVNLSEIRNFVPDLHVVCRRAHILSK